MRKGRKTSEIYPARRTRDHQATPGQVQRILRMRREQMAVTEIVRATNLSITEIDRILRKHLDQTKPVPIADRNHLPAVRSLREAISNGALARMSAVALVKELFGSADT